MKIPSLEIDTAYEEVMKRITPIFHSEPGYKTAQKYLKGLLSAVERKNGWQLSEAIGETTPYVLQQFIYRGQFSADKLRDCLREYVTDKIGEEDGVLVVDETGFLKQGKMSCGVKRQYSGTAGRIENCQIGVFMTYSSAKGHAPIDRRLYIPEDWFSSPERCRKAGVPETLTFQTKPQMALDMIKEATESGVPYRWVTGDCVYGDYTDIRTWLEENKKCYVMSVSGKSYVWRGYKQESVKSILQNLPMDGWFEASCGDGSKGVRVYDWLVIPTNPGTTQGYGRSLMIRRSKSSPDELRAYLCFSPLDTPKQKLAEVAGKRWTVETCFKESKSEVGLDQYEVRSYNGWYKHVTFACLAIALLTHLSCSSFDGKSIQQHNPSSSSLDEFKKGRGLLV
jgi:SRSO17 transposase